MVRYDSATKDKALALAAKVGVKQAAEELKVSVPTLYKWRSEVPKDKGASATTKSKATGSLADALGDTQHLEEKLLRLEAENTALRKENDMLHNKLAQIKKAALAFFE